MTAAAPRPAAPTRTLPLPLLLAGLAGSALVAVGSTGVGALPRGGWLGMTALSDARPLAVLLAAVGMAGLVAVWWRVRRLLDRLQTRAVVHAAAVWALPLLVAPPIATRDVYAYAGQGLVVGFGLDPYESGPGAVGGRLADEVDDVWRDVPSPYGPVFLRLADLVVRVSGESVVVAVLLLRLLAVAGLVLVAWGLPRLAAHAGVPPQRALWLGLANPLVLLHGVGGAHNEALMVGLLVAACAVALPTPRRFLLAGALVALAGLVKAPAFAALAFLPLAEPGVRARLRAGALLAAGAVATTVLVTVASGLGTGWLGAVDAGRARLSLFSPLTGAGVALGEALTAVGLVDDRDGVLDVVLALGLPAGALVTLALLVRARRLGVVQALGLALLAVAVLGAVVQPWYLMWGLPLVAAIARPRLALGLAVLTAALCFTVLPSGRSVIRPPLYGVPLLAAATLAVVVVRRSDVGERRDGVCFTASP